jgi:ABC-type ATPase with predicted acetyltransferase domain
VIAVAVLSYPTPALRTRERALSLTGPRYGERLRWINANLRTISRVIVHPQFRSLGLASQLVRRVLEDCPTRYVEAVAAMGLVHPFFVRAGMTLHEPMSEGESAYFLFDRGH